jgi:hypothetical protein
MKMFKELDNKTSSAYCSLIKGMIKVLFLSFLFIKLLTYLNFDQQNSIII